MTLTHTAKLNTHSQLAALTLGTIGVVFGDIGTSPLYAVKGRNATPIKRTLYCQICD